MEQIAKYDAGLPLMEVINHGVFSEGSQPILKVYDNANSGAKDDDNVLPTIQGHFFFDVGAAYWDEMLTLARKNAGIKISDLEKEKVKRWGLM